MAGKPTSFSTPFCLEVRRREDGVMAAEGGEEETGLDSDMGAGVKKSAMGKGTGLHSDGDYEAEEGGSICDVPKAAEIDKISQKELWEQLHDRGLVKGGAKADQRARLLKALGHTVTVTVSLPLQICRFLPLLVTVSLYLSLWNKTCRKEGENAVSVHISAYL